MTLYMYWLKIKGMLTDKKGQGMVEYVLIIAFIAIVLILTLTNLGGAIGAKFQEIIDAL